MLQFIQDEDQSSLVIFTQFCSISLKLKCRVLEEWQKNTHIYIKFYTHLFSIHINGTIIMNKLEYEIKTMQRFARNCQLFSEDALHSVVHFVGVKFILEVFYQTFLFYDLKEIKKIRSLLQINCLLTIQ